MEVFDKERGEWRFEAFARREADENLVDSKCAHDALGWARLSIYVVKGKSESGAEYRLMTKYASYHMYNPPPGERQGVF